MKRGFFLFDTSAIPDNAVISAASLYLYALSANNDDADGYDYQTVVQTFQATTSELVSSDFEDCGSDNGSGGRAKYTPIEGIDSGDRLDIDNVTTSAYNSFPLNTTGIGWISTSSWTKLGMRDGHDAADHAIVPPDSSNPYNQINWESSEESGTSKDPYLEVTYAVNEAPTAPTSLEAEGQTNPTDITDTTPEFTAIYNDPNSGDLAPYYQIQVTATSSDWTNLMWDSGTTTMATTTEGNRCSEISYDGTLITLDGSTYYWRIKFWDDDDTEGAWSTATSTFAMSEAMQNFTYTYDKVGNITRIIDGSDTNNAEITDFTYDDLYRLTRASSTDAAYGGDYLRTYAYNAIGNITNKSDQGAYTYGGHLGTSFVNPHGATQIGENSYTYDNNGNVTSAGDWNHY